MITRRILINLFVFFAAAAVLVVYGLINLLGDPFQTPMPISTVLPSAYGVYPNFSVTLNGVQIGTVSSVSLTRTGSRVDMNIDPGVKIPGDVAASVEIANTLGEQQIDLEPQQGGTAPPLRAGAQVPMAPGGAPADIGQVIATATQLLKAIPVGDLNDVLRQTAVALNGRGGDLRTIITSGQQFAREFLAYQLAFKSLLASSPPVLNSVTTVAPQLTNSLANTAIFLDVLSNKQAAFLDLLHSGADASQLLNQFVVAERPNLACVVHDLGAVSTNLSLPTNLHNLATDLATNQVFFGAVQRLAVFGPARQVTASLPARTDQLWLRTRLILPPVLSPAAVTYSPPHTLSPIIPGAGCDTEFGQGVGPATQPGFVPAAPVPIETPTAADAQVRGGGPALVDPPPATTPTAFHVRQSPFPPAPTTVLPVLGAAVLFQRPVRRRWAGRRNRRRHDRHHRQETTG